MSFKIFLIYHSHIDIGYTERQERITNYQADFIKQAVDCALSPKQKAREIRSKFKFVAEGFWAVERYLEKYGEEGKTRLCAAIGTGSIELSATYLHNAELLDFNTYDWEIKKCFKFLQENNLKPTDVAMSADVNGLSSGHAASLYHNGVRKYFTCINTHHGGAPFGKPLVPFYWKTVSGDKLLVWNGLTYHKGNLLGLIPGWTTLGGVGIPGCTDLWTLPKNIKSVKQCAKKRVFSMVEGLKKTSYPYDFVPIMAGGCYTDNNPIGDGHCDMIEEWNRLYGNDIEIISSTIGEFFGYLIKNTDTIPTFEGEWNDWWTDGVLSTPIETNLFRTASRLQRKILATPNFEGKIIRSEIERLNYFLALYSEHTWGHSQSLSHPSKFIVKQLDVRKGNPAIKAYQLAGELWRKIDTTPLTIQPAEGSCFNIGTMTFANKYYTIAFDGNGVKKYCDAKGESLLSYDNDKKLGQPIYQIFENGDRSACAGFGYSKRNKLPHQLYFGSVKEVRLIENNNGFCRVLVAYDLKGTMKFDTIFTMYVDKSKLDITTQMLKNLEFSPEGVYVAFPLETKGGKWYLDKPKSLSPVGYQLPGTCCDYYSCIRGVVLKGIEKSIVVNMYGSPMVTFGKIKLWDFSTEIEPTGALYSWQSNNKWETNFRCECSGAIENSYSIEVANLEDIENVISKNDLDIAGLKLPGSENSNVVSSDNV